MDEAQLKDLYLRYGYLVRRRCAALLRSTVDAEDALQEVFLRVRHYGPPRGEKVTLGWLYTVAQNCCFDLIRKHGKDRGADPSQKQALASRFQSAGVGDPEHAAQVRQFLRGVDARTREIGVLHHLDGLTQEEVAARTGYSRKTVGRKLAVFEALARAWWQGDPDAEPR